MLIAADNAPAGGNPILQSFFVPMIIIGVLFYFMLIRPERRRRTELDQMLENLKKNDRVVTIGGIHGTVVNVQKEDVTIKVDETTRLRVLRSAISRVESREDQGASKKETT